MEVRVIGDALSISPSKRIHELCVQHLLTQQLLLPDGFVKKLFAEGRVRIGSKGAEPGQVIGNSQKLWLLGGIAAEQNCGAENYPFQNTEHGAALHPVVDGTASSVPTVDVLFEDDHLVVVNKPPELLIHHHRDLNADVGPARADVEPADVEPARRSVERTGVNQMNEHALDDLDTRVCHYLSLYGSQVRVRHVHRLDKGTSGAILYAKHDYSGRALDKMLLQRQIGRTYIALIQGHLADTAGTFTGAIGRHRHIAGRYRVSKTGRKAVTHYSVLEQLWIGNDALSLVACTLETGRTHQIRVHFQDAGHPIVGDGLYGGGNGFGTHQWERGFALHALALKFMHPYTGQLISTSAPLPASWNILREYVGLDTIIDTLFR